MSIVFEGFGNILTHKAQTITVPVNVVGVMGAGLALAISNRRPDINPQYKKLCNSGAVAVGRCACITSKNSEKDKKNILLFPTKAHWKEPSSVKIIESGLKHLVENYKELGITSLALPALGCGLGQLDYIKDVRPLMVKYLDPLDIDVYILLRNKFGGEK